MVLYSKLNSVHSPQTSLLIVSRNAKLLYWWTLGALMVPNLALCFTEHFTPLQSATNIILPLGIIWLLMSITRKVGVTVWCMFPLIFFAAFQLVLLSIYGRSVIAVDMFLNVVTTNSSEAGELLKGLLPAIGCVVVLYLPPLIAGTVAIFRHKLLSSGMLCHCRRLSRITLFSGLILLGLSLASSTPYSPLRQLYPLNAAYNLVLAVDRSDNQLHYTEMSGNFSFGATATDSIPEITMIVIGETSRASSWQLFGYDRPTTPHLSARTDVIAFPRALSQSNTTHKSVPLMLSHLDASEFGDSIYHVKGVITAFREAGVHTVFISNQDRNGALIDSFGEEADTCIFLADSLSHSRTDMSLIPVVRQIIAAVPRNGKTLIVVHTYGSHYEYSDRYPDDMARFMPVGQLEAKAECRQCLVNAYDNSILLTDHLLSAFITDLSNSGIGASLIYTSDHGEDIFDDNRNLFLHASPIPTYEQLHVPLILWMNAPYRESHPDRYLGAVANSHRPVATSTSLFHTAMQLGGLDSPQTHSESSLVSNSYKPAEYTYLDDHNEAVLPIVANLDQCDIIRIDSLYTGHIPAHALAATIARPN